MGEQSARPAVTAPDAAPTASTNDTNTGERDAASARPAAAPARPRTIHRHPTSPGEGRPRRMPRRWHRLPGGLDARLAFHTGWATLRAPLSAHRRARRHGVFVPAEGPPPQQGGPSTYKNL